MKKSFKKISALILITSIVFSMLMPITASAVNVGSPVDSSLTGRTIYFGVYPQSYDGLASNSNNVQRIIENAQLPFPGNLAYYKYEPIAWEVVEASGDKTLMVTEDILTFRNFDGGTKNWDNSAINAWLNNAFANGETETSGTWTSNIKPAFSGAEANALAAGNRGSGSKVFLLDSTEAAKLTAAQLVSSKTNYAGTKTQASTSNPDRWMIYSDNLLRKDQVLSTGVIDQNSLIAGYRSGIKPAVNLDRDSVIMLSGAVNSKPTAPTNNFEIATLPSGDLKATVVDTSGAMTLTVDTFNGAALGSTVLVDKNAIFDVVSSKYKVPVAYSGATTGSNVFVSAVLLDENNKVVYYAVLDQGNAAGTVDLEFSDIAAMDTKTYTLKIFTEKRNADFTSDITSVPVTSKLTVSSSPVQAPAFTITDVNGLAASTKTEAYSQEIAATGTPLPLVELVGTLPAGLEFKDGHIQGTPTVAGTFPVAFTAKNSVLPDANITYNLVIADKTTPVITNTSTTLTSVIQGAAVNETITTTGAPAPQFRLKSGSVLPQGLSINAATGVISGTVTAPIDSYEFIIEAYNTAGVAEQTFYLEVLDPNPPKQVAILTTTLSDGVEGSNFDQTISFEGSPTPIIYVINTNLPAGALSIDPVTGLLSVDIVGQSVPAGSYQIVLGADNTVSSDSQFYTFNVISSALAVAPTITTTTVANGQVGTAYSAKIDATGTPAPTFKEDPTSPLPAGLTIAPDGTISGTPTAAVNGGTFKVIATNNFGTDAVKTFTITIAPAVTTTAPTFTSAATLPNAKVGDAYSTTVTATGTTPITFSLKAGSVLPAGLTLSTNGTISGTPTADAAGATFTIVASNGTLPNAEQVFTLTINQASTTVTPPTPPTPAPTVTPTITVTGDPLALDYEKTKVEYVTVTLGTSGTNATVTFDNSNVNTDKNTLTADGVIKLVGNFVGTTKMTVTVYDAANNVLLTKTVTINITKKPVDDGRISGGGGGGRGGSGGGGGGSISTVTGSTTSRAVATANNPYNLVTNQVDVWDAFMTRIPAAVNAAKTAKQAFAPMSIKGAAVITKDRAKLVVQSAAKSGGAVLVNADTVIGNAVVGRLSIDPSKVDRDILLGVLVDYNPVYSKVVNMFKNKVHTVTFRHQGEAGQVVKVSAKVNLQGVNTKNLVFYTYDATTNKYVKIAKPNYWIDANGYLRFETSTLKHVIISEGALVSK